MTRLHYTELLVKLILAQSELSGSILQQTPQSLHSQPGIGTDKIIPPCKYCAAVTFLITCGDLTLSQSGFQNLVECLIRETEFGTLPHSEILRVMKQSLLGPQAGSLSGTELLLRHRPSAH